VRSALREDEIGSPTWAREDHVVFDPSCFAVLVDQVPAALSGSKTPPRVVTSGYKLRVRSGSSAHREPVDDGSGRKPALGRVLLGRRAQLQRAVRPPGAVLDRMPGKHTTQISFVGRSASGRSVSGAHGQYEALGEAVRPRATWRVGGDPGDVRDYMLTRLTARLHGPDAWWADV